MPIHLSPHRREFLAASLAVGVSCVTLRAADMPLEEDRYALLADTHIPADPKLELRGVNMAANLESVVRQLLAKEKRSAAAFILGDCAYLNGQPEDYRQLSKHLAPLGEKQWSVHLALGNHDHRQHCLEAFPAEHAPLTAKLERRVAVIPGRKANWFLLDSLDKVNVTPGALGKTQLQWLAETLDRHSDRPALIGVHHNPLSGTLSSPSKVAGLVDTAELLEVLESRRFVKAMFFGHTHAWSVVEHAGIHLVNLPPVAYTFAKDKPNGWTDCLVGEDRAELTMYCHDTSHTEHGRTLELRWRRG